jgi:hypothetical protein
MQRVIARIVARHDPPDDFAARAGEEEFGIAVLIKWMFLPIEELFPLDQQWRHPGRIVRVNPPRKFDKGVQVGARANWVDVDLSHDCFLNLVLSRRTLPAPRSGGFQTAAH